jgi:hypothetical protein
LNGPDPPPIRSGPGEESGPPPRARTTNRRQPQPSAVTSIVAVGRDEAACRIEAATALLSQALVGQVPLELAAETAVRLLERARRFLEVAA